tara:strand:+ start:1224 stop:1796 length:573 start_codon:yes stop_codon:yes gene_type:complete
MRLAQLTQGGPWHLLNSIPDMGALILLVVAAAEGGPAQTAGTIAGTCPEPTPPAKKGKADPMLAACQAAGAATAEATAEEAAAHPRELEYIRKAVADALLAQDLFTLRWFTFVAMHLSDTVVAQLSCGAPTPVVDRFLVPFKATMSNHLFGRCHRAKKGTRVKEEHVISTPLEMVVMFMIHLKASYFVQG